MFDFRDYPQDSKLLGSINKKVISKIKDEFEGETISEFVILKSKMYSLVTIDNEEIKKAKEVNKNVVKNTRRKRFVDVLFNKKNNET